MMIEQLRADYESEKDCVDTWAAMRIMAAMPAVLEVLNAAVKYRDTNDWYDDELLRDAVDKLTGL